MLNSRCSSTGMVPRPSRSAELFQEKWVCASHSPDIRVRPRPSITRAPSARSPSTVPTATMRSSSTRTSPGYGSAPVESRTETLRKRILLVGTGMSASSALRRWVVVGSEELLEQVGDRAGGFERGPVPDAGQDLDRRLPVGPGDVVAGVGRSDLVVGAGDEQQRQPGGDRAR